MIEVTPVTDGLTDIRQTKCVWVTVRLCDWVKDKQVHWGAPKKNYACDIFVKQSEGENLLFLQSRFASKKYLHMINHILIIPSEEPWDEPFHSGVENLLILNHKKNSLLMKNLHIINHTTHN